MTIDQLTALITAAAGDELAIWDADEANPQQRTKKITVQDIINSAVTIAGLLKQTDVVNNLTSTSTTAPLSAAQGKALNDKIDQFSVVSFTPETGVTSNLFVRRYGSIVCVNGYLTADSAFGNTSTLLGVIASGNYPINSVRVIAGVSGNAYSAGDTAYVGIANDGKITIVAKSGNIYKTCYFSASYVVQS